MEMSTKKRLTCMVIGISSVFCGIEHAIILPSAWGYLQSRFPGTHTIMLGSLLASYNLGALLAVPLSGWWSWTYTHTRLILLTLNIFSIAGSTFYFMAQSAWSIVASRFLSGLGFGCQSALLVDLSRAVMADGTVRRAVFLVHLSRQLGLFLGPVFYLPLESASYPATDADIRIDKYSSPGVFLAALFIFEELLLLFGYHNLTVLNDQEYLREQLSFQYYQRFSLAGDVSVRCRLRRTSSLPHHLWSSVFSPTVEIARAAAAGVRRDRDTIDSPFAFENESDVAIESAEHFIMSASLSQSLPNNAQKFDQCNQSEGHASHKSENRSLLQVTDRLISEPSICFEPVSRLDRLRACMQEFSDEYLRDDTVVLLAVIFLAVTIQTQLEVIAIFLTKEIYVNSERVGSFVFILIGFQLFLVVLFGQLIRRLVVDRVLLLVGLVLLLLALVCLLLVLPQLDSENQYLVPYLLASGVTCFLSAPTLVVCSSSLLINITSHNKQIMTQGLSQCLICAGSVLGPLWAGAVWSQRYLLVSLPLGFVLIITVLYVLSFRHMIRSGSSRVSSRDGECCPPFETLSTEYKAIVS